MEPIEAYLLLSDGIQRKIKEGKELSAHPVMHLCYSCDCIVTCMLIHSLNLSTSKDVKSSISSGMEPVKWLTTEEIKKKIKQQKSS